MILIQTDLSSNRTALKTLVYMISLFLYGCSLESELQEDRALFVCLVLIPAPRSVPGLGWGLSEHMLTESAAKNHRCRIPEERLYSFVVVLELPPTCPPLSLLPCALPLAVPWCPWVLPSTSRPRPLSLIPKRCWSVFRPFCVANQWSLLCSLCYQPLSSVLSLVP